MPRYFYFLETLDTPVSPDHPAWQSVLPTSRDSSWAEAVEPAQPSITLGDYFKAVHRFLNGPSGLDAIRRLTRRGKEAAPADEVRVFLSKHGEFYHPSQVVIEFGGQLTEMVVNVAVSDAGKKLIQKEYDILKRLNREYTRSYLPEVFTRGELTLEGKPSIAMFLGQWFSGFQEFHLTGGRTDSERHLAVWEPETGHRLLNQSQIITLYAQIAKILTYYFDPLTGESIHSWHHAAGDFVVRLTESGLEVRLVTVREYKPLFKGGLPGQDIKSRLEALLIFFLHLSLRTRLDRRDGVGEIQWASVLSVEGTLSGTLDALAQKPLSDDQPLPSDELFRHYLRLCSEGDLLDMCAVIVDTYHPLAPEIPLLKTHLRRHAAELAHAISRI